MENSETRFELAKHCQKTSRSRMQICRSRCVNNALLVHAHFDCLLIVYMQAGASCNKIDGCVHCDKHVWEQKDKGKSCPLCGGERYDANGHAFEQILHFPLKPRLEALMRDSPAFREAVNYEKHRPRSKDEGITAGPYLLTLPFTCLTSPLPRRV